MADIFSNPEKHILEQKSQEVPVKQPFSRRSLLKNTLRTAGIGIGIQAVHRRGHASQTPGTGDSASSKARYTPPPYAHLADAPQALFQAKGFDTLVIGSGYGGSVLAARLKARFPQKSLALLEKGKEWAPGDYPKTLMQAARETTMTNPLGLYDFQMLKDLDIFQGSGLGGTSLVNANVAIEPDAEMWAQDEWPKQLHSEFQSGKMAEYFRRAREALQPETYPVGQGNWPVLQKDEALREGAQATGGRFRMVEVAVNFSRSAGATNFGGVHQQPCALCASCVTGCNFGSKNTLNMNYLPFAKRAGAKIFTQVAADFIRELKNDSDGYRYAVVYTHRDIKGKMTRGEIKARNVVVAAGVLGSNKILLRSKALGALRLSNALGSRVSSNGDTYGMGLTSRRRTDIMGIGVEPLPNDQGYPGPTMEAGAVYNSSPNLKDRFIIEHSSIPDFLNTPVDVFIGLRNPEGVSDPLNHSMLYLGCGHDDANGKISLGKDGKVQLIWPNLRNQPVFKNIKAAIKAQAEHIGAEYTSPDFRGHPITVHPLGGCVMAETAERGTVDASGRAFDSATGKTVNAGLYVADGSIVPTSIGVNPFLTITALCERIADLIEEKDL